LQKTKHTTAVVITTSEPINEPQLLTDPLDWTKRRESFPTKRCDFHCSIVRPGFTAEKLAVSTGRSFEDARRVENVTN